MTDFDYDCYKKKTIARSAAKRKCGSKSKKCSLPSDNLTNKEWKERCGDVLSFRIGKPMLWAEFQGLPNDLKEEYLNNLIDKFSANAKNIADMFGVNPATVARVVKTNGLNVKFLKGKHPSGEKMEAFKSFLSGECYVEENHEQQEDYEDEVNQPLETEKATAPATYLDSFTLNFSGEINIDMIANSLRYILPVGGKAKIQLICDLENY